MSDLIAWLPAVAGLLAASVIGGLLAGLFGIGGGIVLVPALDLALELGGVAPDTALKIAVATSMATIIPTAISSGRSHARRGFVDRQIVRHWAAPIVCGAATGALLASYVDTRLLAAVFAVVSLLVAMKMLLPMDGVVIHQGLPQGFAGVVPPFLIGLVSSMMGIGGGVLGVAVMTLCGVLVHTAVGTAATLGLWLSVPATLAYLLFPVHDTGLPPGTVGYVSLPGFLAIAPVTSMFAPVGARIAHSLSRRKLSVAFGGFLLLVAVRMFYRMLA